MRKVVYSGFVKFVAVILFIVSIVFGTFIASGGIIELQSEDRAIYGLESDFSESSFIAYLVDQVEDAVFMAYHDVIYKNADSLEYDERQNMIAENSEEVAQKIRERLDHLYYSDKINYYVQWNDLVITNCGAQSPEELITGEIYSYIKRDSNGEMERVSSYRRRSYMTEELEDFDKTSTIIISCKMKDEVVKEYKAAWEKQESIVIETFLRTLACVIAALLMLIYLLCVCGKSKDGEYRNLWLDHIWAEVHLAAMATSGVGAVVICVLVLDEYMYGHFPHNLLYPVLGTASALGSTIIITSMLSIIRNIKTRRLVEKSLILSILRWIIRFLRFCLDLLRLTVKWIGGQIQAFWSLIFRTLSKKTGVFLICGLFVYTALIGLLGLATPFSPLFFILGILLFVLTCILVSLRAKDFDEIKKGINEVRKGNVSYKIPYIKSHDMKTLAVNINDIAKGLDESVAAKVKAERMKTELITNVSHDLKTPITSIISYTELLSKMEGLPEEAKDYISVIAKKSDRLKKLTQDLFDISKVQSGNEDVVLEKLDAALLINQSLAEHDNEIQDSGLLFRVEAQKELYFSADGRKMSRVVSNLISNILKYALKNTRVFITAAEKEGNVVMEFKNISAYPLDFDVEEITQRFVRGEESRTEEGNGLGLAIVKSYTEICGGSFEIVADGDMFKAILKFRKYS